MNPRFETYMHDGDPGLPGGRGRKDVARVAVRKGKWHKPEDNKDRDPENDRRAASVVTASLGLILKSGMVPAGGVYHDSFITPAAPYLVPLLFGISVSQMDAIEGCEKGNVRHVPFAVMSLWATWETAKIFWEAAARHGSPELISAGLCVGGILLGRTLKISPKKP